MTSSPFVAEPVAVARSPEAERFDPPVWKARWVPAQTLGWREFLADARERLGARAGDLERALWHGGLHVSGVPIDPAQPPATIAAGGWVAIYGFTREPEPLALDPRCVFHDADGLVAVDKPPWLSMQRTRASFRSSLEDQLQVLLGDATLFAVHRLDRQTSGVALFARGRERAAEIGRAFAARRVAKRYLACVAPPPTAAEFAVRGFLGRVAHPSRFKFGLFDAPGEGRRESSTRFALLARDAERAKLAAEPATGRTHQLRVHLAAQGCPIVGDDLYGPAWRAGAPSAAPRVLLHAARLTLPRASGALVLEAPEPADLAHFAAELSGAADARMSAHRE